MARAAASSIGRRQSAEDRNLRQNLVEGILNNASIIKWIAVTVSEGVVDDELP